MKKTIVMLATLIMSFAFAISVMAAPSPEDEHDDDNGPTTTSQKKETQERLIRKQRLQKMNLTKTGIMEVLPLRRLVIREHRLH